jgi:hypothetical protein
MHLNDGTNLALNSIMYSNTLTRFGCSFIS